jgi:hypothetical protein
VRECNDTGDVRVPPNEVRVCVLHEKIHLHVRKPVPECADQRGREDDIADGTKADD